MISVPAGARIVVATEPVDGRKGMDSLAAVVQQPTPTQQVMCLAAGCCLRWTPQAP